jgi:hypothetical protein
LFNTPVNMSDRHFLLFLISLFLSYLVRSCEFTHPSKRTVSYQSFRILTFRPSGQQRANGQFSSVPVCELKAMNKPSERSWDYTRIKGALANLRHRVGRGTIANVLKVAGVEPALTLKNGVTWREFLRAHWEVLAATDFSTVEVWTDRGLVRYHVLFVIQLAARAAEIAGVVPETAGGGDRFWVPHSKHIWRASADLVGQPVRWPDPIISYS